MAAHYHRTAAPPGPARPRHGTRVRLSYAKVAEFQRRGLVHFHAIIRLDGTDPTGPYRVIIPHPALTAQLLTAAIRAAAASVWFATVPHPAKPKGWDICWGPQLDIRTVRMSGAAEITDTAVACYLAKYATKSTEAVGPVAVRITTGNLHAYASPLTHHGRLIAPPGPSAATRTRTSKPCDAGHTCSDSAATSPPSPAATPPLFAPCAPPGSPGAAARTTPPSIAEETTLIVGRLTYVGTGWRTSGDEFLALSAAARAREHRRIARDEAVGIT